MTLSLSLIEQASSHLRSQIDSGTLAEGCSMSAIQTPVKEAWCQAEDLIEKGALSLIDKQKLLSQIMINADAQLLNTDSDDFDLIYEYLLQTIDAA